MRLPKTRRARWLALAAIAVSLTVGSAAILISGQPSSGNADLPRCPYEDGHPNGKPCNWTDPDTGRVYLIDSSEYRN